MDWKKKYNTGTDEAGIVEIQPDVEVAKADIGIKEMVIVICQVVIGMIRVNIGKN